MNMRRPSALIFNNAVVVTEISKYALLEDSLNNGIHKDMEIFYNSKRILKHHFETISCRKPFGQKLFWIDPLTGIE